MTQSQSTTVSEMMLNVLENIERNIDSMAKQKPRNNNREIFNSLSVGSMAKRALPAVGAAGFMAYAKSVIDTEAGMSRLSKILNVAATELLSMERAGRRFNTSFSQGLMNIKSQFAGLEQEDVSALYESLARYGVKDPTSFMEAIDKDDTMGLFRELQKVWTDLNNNQKLRMSETLGLDRGMMDILNDPEKFNRYKDETNVTNEDIKSAEKAKESMDKLAMKLDQFMTKVVNGLIPSIDKLVSWLNQMDPNQLASALGLAADGLLALVGSLDRIFGTKDTDDKPLQPEVLDTKSTITQKKKELAALNDMAKGDVNLEMYRSISNARWILKDEIANLEQKMSSERDQKIQDINNASPSERMRMLASGEVDMSDFMDRFSANQTKVDQISESQPTVSNSTNSEDNRSRSVVVQFNNEFNTSTNDREQIKRVVREVQEEQFREAIKQDDWP